MQAALYRYLTRAVARAMLRRAFRGPERPTWSFHYEATVIFLRHFMRHVTQFPYPRLRHEARGIRGPLSRGVRLSQRELAGKLVLEFEPSTLKHETVLFYVHGGGYVFGSARHEQGFASLLARELGCRVIAVEYRLAPEDPCPAAADDVFAAYVALLSELPERPGAPAVAMVGVSAGCGVFLGALKQAQQQGVSLPALCVACCPFVDAACDGPSWTSNAGVDWLEQGSARAAGLAYAAQRTLNDPLVSPIYMDLTGFPRLLLFSGAAECVADDALALELRAQQCGVSVSHLVEPDMVHAYMTLGVAHAARARCLSMIERALSASPLH